MCYLINGCNTSYLMVCILWYLQYTHKIWSFMIFTILVWTYYMLILEQVIVKQAYL